MKGSEILDGEHVPDFPGDDVGDEDVDVVGGVGDFAFAVDEVDGLYAVSAEGNAGRTFELDAPQAPAGIHDEVVAFAIAPGFGDVEAFVGGLVQEGSFGIFSGALGIGAGPGAVAGGLK